MQVSKRDQILATNLAGPLRRMIGDEEMPLLRSSINERQTCRESKEIRFKQQTLQGPEKDQLTVKRCRC